MSSNHHRNRRLSTVEINQRSRNSLAHRNYQYDCKLCRRDHPLRTCHKFMNMTVKARLKVVEKFKYCVNCLAHSHRLNRCRSSDRCRRCNRQHHTLLHSRPVIREVNANPAVNLFNLDVLRPTAIIRVKLGDVWANIRCVLNPSSEATKIAAFLPKRYHLPIERSGLRRMCSLTFKPHFVDGPMYIVNAILTNELPQPSRAQNLEEKVADQYKNLHLADPDFFKACDINIILGADVYPHVIKSTIHPATLTTPMAQDTMLGWILIGRIRI